eukprot:GFYU01004102.1.p1 GENE.GFYU01004102.1~~GFYU01004102.1.p1  ORF type:complete len:285 (-),score=96.56 GFYU01004102.1:212-1066(-)
MNAFKDGWFTELGSMWPGQAMSIEVEKVLFEGKSDFQDVIVFQSKNYGRVLVLDGVIQATERDEFAYQEMICNIPMMSHPNPKKVLVIGGGDGGVLREIAKHKSVESMTICEIDKTVIEMCKEHIPSMACGFSDPRLTVHIGDGFEFLKNNKDSFDVIITDSSDPVGPAESLYQEPYYKLMHDALREGGIVCTQGECQWLHLDLIKELITFSKGIYAHAEYGYTTIPTYPSGQIGFILCSKGGSCKAPAREMPEGLQEQLKYYNPDVHRAGFVLPQFTKLKLES